MADKTLGKLLSRSIRRSRGSRGSRDSRGSLDMDADTNSSIGSDDVTLSRGRSITSRNSELADIQSHDTGSTHGITFNVPDNSQGEVAEEPSLVSGDSEDPELLSIIASAPGGQQNLSVPRFCLSACPKGKLDLGLPGLIIQGPAESHQFALDPNSIPIWMDGFQVKLRLQLDPSIGYLTTNSPIIQSEYQGSQSSQYSFTTDNFGEPGPSGSTDLYGLAPPVSQSSRRSPSPVGRLKGVFRSKKSSSKLSGGGSGTSSPERRPTSADSRLSTETTEAPNLTDPPRSYPTTDAEPDTKNPAIEVNTGVEERTPSSERFRRLSKGQSVNTTSTPPGTPGGSEKGTPVIVNTPPTPTNPDQPRFRSPRKSNASADAAVFAPNRGRSGSASLVPSKLSTIASAPLTPTLESGDPTPLNPSSGFFTSVLSAAQNAANTLTHTIQNTNTGPGQVKHKGSAPIQTQQDNEVEDDRIEVEPSAEASSNTLMDSKEPAIKTLGMGDLSLSQLGIEPVSRAPTPTKLKFPENPDVGRSRSESAPGGATPIKTTLEAPWDDAHRPRTSYDSPHHGDKTPPTGSLYEESSSVHRSGSIKSALSRNRKRGSTNGTGGTGNTIGAAIAAANASLGGPSANANAPKLTGFAVASKKRNRDFHVLFKSVPDDDYLIEDYSCALQREILAHGRLYVSEGHLCFSSNILGWVTTLVMSFDEIVSVEKRSTALLFKNGLMISTLHAKHIFASFTSRDSTYDLIVKIWKLGHPGLQSSLNGVKLDETGGDKTEKIDAESAGSAGSAVGDSRSASASDEEEDESDDGEDVYDEDEEEEEDNAPAVTQSAEAPLLESALEKSITRKPSGAINGSAPADKPKDAPAAPAVQDFQGPATHAPTDCGDSDTHYKKIVGDDVVPAPLGKVYDLLFGSSSAAWMGKWLTGDQKCTDLQMEDKRGLSQDNRTRNFSYIKPLSGSIGPKQTKCLVTENLENLDFEQAVNILVSTQNPDVPSGNVFSVKTKYCLSWAENNATRVQINCTVEWTGKSWLKTPIENGANEGQTQYCKDLFASLKAAVSSKPRAGPTNGVAKGKKKGKKGKSEKAANVTSDTEAEASKASSKPSNWGPLEPLHDIVGPVLDIVGPLLTTNVIYGLLVGLLIMTWLSGRSNRHVARPYGSELGFYGYPDRIAAYEEMWRREESELWEWLEERVGMDRLNSGELHTRKRVMEPRTAEEKLREEHMDEREIKEAIKITEEKLHVLKSVVEKKDFL
ncbi:hypothetical protein VM1G_04166 [Cytospora mali]|uniref:VASt domain-containing protein n=1 Tax=Cytospora mali TaxID=578113 RepID=A0A194VWF5_CYTMA|nr:hypothetical protein VM1G_04166 [Valsa mali]